MLALAAPAAAVAAGEEGDAGERSRAAAALGQNASEGEQSPSRAAIARDPLYSEDQDAGATLEDPEVSGEERDPDARSGDDSTLDASRGDGTSTASNGKDSPLAQGTQGSPARAATARGESNAGGPPAPDLDGLGDAIRRDTRSRTDGIQRRVRRATSEALLDARADTRPDAARTQLPEDVEGKRIVVSVASGGPRIELYRGEHHFLVGERVFVRGYEPPRRPGRIVVLQVLEGGDWTPVTHTRTVEDGRFELVWDPRQPGRYQLRVRPYNSRSSIEPSGVRRISVKSGKRIELYSGEHHFLVRERVLVRGYEPPRRAGRTVVLQVLSGGDWVPVTHARTGEEGRFALSWYPRNPGRYQVRVRPYNSKSTIEPSGVRRIFVYRRAVASWYGPGFYGNTTACGQTFTSRLMGVAHRSLPCGYLVRIRYNGRMKTVPVVDRGPYIDGRDYDLTEALRNYLRFDGVRRVLATA